MLEFHASLCDYHGTGLGSLGSPKKMIISMLQHRLKSKQVLPTLKRRNEGIEGGFVADAPIALEEKMFEIDLSKEYPSVIMTMNMGLRTHVPDLREIIDVDYNQPIANVREYEEIFPDKAFEPNIKVTIAPTSGNCYRYETESLVASVLKEMATERDQIRKQMFSAEKFSQDWRILNNQQIARKISMNSWYGVLAQVYPEIGGDITDIARRHIKWIREKVGELHMLFNPSNGKIAIGFKEPKEREDFMKLAFEAIYTDTDSAKCKISNRAEQEKKLGHSLTEDDILKIGAAISEKMNRSFADFAEFATGGCTREHYFDVKVEEAYKAYMQAGAKKRYAYLTYGDKIQTRGFDTRRSDSTALTRAAMNTMFDMILKDTEHGMNNFLEWLTNFENEIKEGKYDKDAGKPIGLNTPNPRTQHMKAAMLSNDCLDKNFKVGDKVFLWWVHPSERTNGGSIIALEYGETPEQFGIDVNYDEIIKKFVHRKLDLIVEPLFGATVVNLRANIAQPDLVQDEWDEVF